jgi:hypothetical protein
MGKTDWDVVTNYTDVVTTTLKTVTFLKVQEQVYLRNQGNANFTYTIGSQSGTLTPGQSVTVIQDVSSFTLQAVSGTHTFELRAKEKGTEQTETETDVMSLLADLTQQNNYSVIPTFTNGQLTKVEEKDGSIVKTSSTLTYNLDGTVNTITELNNGKTVVTTLNYVNGEFSSATRAVV